MATLPRWFRVIFITVMLLVCAFLCYYVPVQYELRYEISDLTLSLDTSRQREAKQLYEYDEVVAELPLVQAQLDEIRPLADAAEQRVKDLKAERKTLRETAESLENSRLALNERIAALKVRLDALASGE